MSEKFNLETKDKIKRDIDHQAIRLATELKEEIEDNFSKANEKIIIQQVLINTLEDRININKAIAYLEAGKTFPSDEARETAEYMQNMLLDILKGEENDSDSNRI